jgi:signal transduction histidine kinase
MARFRDLSIGQKLQRASILASCTALLAASASFVFYDVETTRTLMARRILTDAQIVGLNCVSPLLFTDPESARSTLAALRADSAVAAAVVLDKDGHLFADYRRDLGAPAPVLAAAPVAEHRFTDDFLVVSHPIDFEGARIGTVVIQSDLTEVRERVVRYLVIAALVLAGSLLAAIAISRRVHKTIAGPILQLAVTAKIVSDEKDYSVRAATDSNDEVGVLARGFNEMLAQIQSQNAELQASQALLERRVQERTKELEAFSYSVSHDLRAPLRGIDGFSQALLEDYPGKVLDDKGAHYLKRVRANTQRMGELIDDLLQLSRVTRADLVRKPIDVGVLAEKVAGDLQGRDPERRVQFRIEKGLAADADAHLVTIVLENLMGNAWKFTSRKEETVIEVGRDGGNGDPVFFVRDNGAGFDMTYADKLFGVFQRLHSDKDFEGTGIGLATVQRIVGRHGGRIWAEGRVGTGATFFFTLGGQS